MMSTMLKDLTVYFTKFYDLNNSGSEFFKNPKYSNHSAKC